MASKYDSITFWDDNPGEISGSTPYGFYDEESEFGIDVNSIFEVLENSYDERVECYVDDERVSCSTFKDDYSDKVDSLVERMVKFDLECG